VLVEGLRTRFELERDLELAGRLPTAVGLADAIRQLAPDVVVMDISMDGPDPFQTTEDMTRAFPHVSTVFLTAHVRDHFVDAALAAGARGYLFKGDSLDAIVDGLRRAAGGQIVLGPTVLERCRPPRAEGAPAESRLSTLTAKEVEVLRQIGKGMSRNEIARSLHRSVKTIDTHRARIMQKLDIHDRTELALFAVREGLLERE